MGSVIKEDALKRIHQWTAVVKRIPDIEMDIEKRTAAVV